MNSDKPGPTPSKSSTRKPIILIGAPSGAGKTVLSQKIIAGTMPLITELCGGMHTEAPVRHDIRALPVELPSGRVLIIECATAGCSH